MSVPSQTLPIVDIAPFISRSSLEDRKRVGESLHQAAREYGFFYLTGHGVAKEQMDEVLTLGKEFFDLPPEEKEKLSIKNEDMARGYQRLGENVTQYKADYHEGLDLYKPVDPNLRNQRPLHGSNQWPETPSDFRPRLEDWIARMKVIGAHLMEACALGLGIEEGSEEWGQIQSMTDDSFWVMRVIGYPRLKEGHDGVSCGEHKDYGCWTILHQDNTKGALQVLHKRDADDEGTWINADPIPGAFVVNIGEMWEIWTNGLYNSTLHRVIHKGNNYRVSVPFFFEPNWDAQVEPLPAALRIQESEGRGFVPEKKKGLKYGDFLSKKVGGNFALAEEAK